MNLTDKRTKIVATIGPVSESKKMIEQLYIAGMTTARLNFSHGTHEVQGRRIDIIKEVSAQNTLPISIMLDTKGPEIRIGQLDKGQLIVKSGARIIVNTTAQSYAQTAPVGELSVSYDLSTDIAIGQKILIDDGKLGLIVESIDAKEGKVSTIATSAHIVKSNKRVNLPGVKFSLPFLSERDISDILFGLQKGIDFIAASFVNSSADVEQIKAILKREDTEHVKIFAKIESQFAVDHFEEILKVVDGVMVARGDLGLEIPFYDVPVVQKMMIRLAREAGKPIIIATQMLDSMEKTPYPTRAEVADVFLATELGADATMLSGESAAGKFPIEALKVMSLINIRAEKEFYNKLYYPVQLAKVKKISSGKRALIAAKVADLATSGDFRYAIVLSRTGALLAEVAKFRPNVAIIGLTNDPKRVKAFGVTSSVFMHSDTSVFQKLKDEEVKPLEIVKEFGAQKGDRYFVVENDKVTEEKW